MFVDMSLSRSPTYYSSEIIAGSGHGQCLQFWFHMTGEDVGIFKVQILIPTKDPWTYPTIWDVIGDQGDQWKKVSLTLNVDSEYSIVFVTEKGKNGDVAIDDIDFDPSGSCSGDTSTPAQTDASKIFAPCGFEVDSCGWTISDNSKGAIQFQRSTGSSLTARDAPLYDHSRNDQAGHYVRLTFRL